jgi:hypothetical protein
MEKPILDEVAAQHEIQQQQHMQQQQQLQQQQQQQPPRYEREPEEAAPIPAPYDDSPIPMAPQSVSPSLANFAWLSILNPTLGYEN